jgi:GTP cyclohydrolase I
MDPDRRIDEIGQAEVARNLEAALDRLGLDLTETDLQGTPARVAELWRELFSGLDPAGAPKFTSLSNADPAAGLVMARGLRFYSMCAHHLLPFFGRAHVAYLPGVRLAGLGDLARVVDYFSRRPTLQEFIAADVAEFIDKHLEPRGVAVLLEGRHLCMEMRGQKREAVVESSAYRGVFQDPEPRREFLQRLRRR